MKRRQWCCAGLLGWAVLLSGCGTAGLGKSTTAATGSASGATGRVQGGQQPISGAAIHLYAVGSSADGAAATPVLASPVVTDGNGFFDLTGKFACPSAGSLMYIAATGGNAGAGATNASIALMTVLGTCGSLQPSTVIRIDERTTVAAVAALAPFMHGVSTVGSSSLDAAGIAAAFTLARSLVDPSNGSVPGPDLPANATAPAANINSLADSLAACINSTGGAPGDGSACGTLFASLTPTGAPAPSDTVAALLNLMRDPLASTAAIYSLSSPSAPFQPQLTSQPADWTIALSGSGAPAVVPAGCSGAALSGQNAFTNYMLEQPQICRKLVAADLPAPYATNSATNYSTQVGRAAGQMPVVPPGFKVTLYAAGFGNARSLLAAANGDLLLSQPAVGTIVVLRGVDSNGAAQQQFTYASGLPSPYGMAFYPSAASPQFLYVANTDSLMRFPYVAGDTAASAAPTTLATDLPNNGGHSTRSLVFTSEATPRLLIGVGSSNNIANTDTTNAEYHRADVLAYSVAGVFQKVYASGLRNPVGLTLDASGRPWVSINERDGLGDNLPAEYVTHIQEDGFYGWPWYYNGPNADPRLPNNHPELAAQTIVGDTLLQPHFAPLQIAFYTGKQFPTPYRGDLFVAAHGSWNRAVRGGYELLRLRMANGNATGEYEDFMSGFVNPDGTVWGRPAGVAVGADGALYVADDGSNSIWRITYVGQ